MEFKVKHHQATTREQWDGWVNQIQEATYQHGWDWLHYNQLFDENTEQKSFILLENEKTPLAVCALGLTKNTKTGENELSLGGNPLAAPAFVTIQPTLRRKISAEVFAQVYGIAREAGAKKVRMISHPITRGVCDQSLVGFENGFEMKKYGFLSDIKNTAIMNLSLPEETLLNNVSKSHRINVRQAAKKGVSVRSFSASESAQELDANFAAFKNAHYLSAGRWTRPHSTWDAMLARAHQGQARLFVAFVEEKPISFLYCGEFSKMVWSWSQANLEEYEREYSPRHILEWEAILHYRKLGFLFYELGELYFGPHWLYQASAKEVSISHFKELFGGSMFPKINWVGYLDEGSMKQDFSASLQAFSQKDLFHIDQD